MSGEQDQTATGSRGGGAMNSGPTDPHPRRSPVHLNMIVAGQLPTERLLHYIKFDRVSGTPRAVIVSPRSSPTDGECRKDFAMVLPGELTLSIGASYPVRPGGWKFGR